MKQTIQDFTKKNPTIVILGALLTIYGIIKALSNNRKNRIDDQLETEAKKAALAAQNDAANGQATTVNTTLLNTIVNTIYSLINSLWQDENAIIHTLNKLPDRTYVIAASNLYNLKYQQSLLHQVKSSLKPFYAFGTGIGIFGSTLQNTRWNDIKKTVRENLT